MAELTAKLSGVDGLSGIFEKMADAGKKAAEYLESAGKAANAAFSQAAESSNKLIETAQKAQDAVKSQSAASEQAAKTSVELSKAANAVTSTYAEMQDVLERTSRIAEAAADNDKLSAETKNKLAEADSRLLTAAKKLTQAQDEAAKAAENLTKVTQSEEISQNEIEKALKQASKAADDLARANDNAASATRKAGQAADEAAVELKENSVATAEAAAQALAGAGFAVSIGVIKDAFKTAAIAAIEFESAITGVYKTVDGNSAQLKQIRDDIKAMSTEMPASASAIASVAESAGQLGVAADDITSFTKVMINLGEATNLSADEAASSLAKFTNITGMSARDYERLGSTIVALGNNFATTEADIVAMSTRMASAGTLAGLTEPQILALAASMSSVGIEAEAGGSAMSKLLTDIQIAVETGSDRLGEFASVAGMTGGEFARAFGENAADALQSFITGLNDTARNGATATVILEDMGLTEVRLSNAVKSLANNSEGLNSAIELANSAWQENTALAAEAGLRYSTLESRISMAKNAAANLSAAVGDDLTPIIGRFVDTGTGVLVWLTETIDKCPVVSAFITGMSTAFVAVAGAITAYTTATAIATAVTKAFGVASMSALWPLYAVAGAIGAVVGLTVGLSNAASEAEKEYNAWTASTKRQYDELQRLNAEYDNATAIYEETSGAVLDLWNQIDELTGAFESNKQTFEQFQAQHDALMKSHDELMRSYASASSEIKKEEIGTLALINKISELQSKTSLTAGEHEQMAAIVGSLNKQLPDLALSYDKVTGSLNKSTDAIKDWAKAEAERQLQEEQSQAYIEALKQQEALVDAVTAAEQNLADERKRAADTWYIFAEDSMSYKWLTKVGEYERAVEKARAALEENQKFISDTEAGWERQTAAQEEAAKATAHITAAYEENEKAITAAKTASDALLETHSNLTESYKTSMAEIRAEENSISVLTSRLAELSGKTSLTASEQMQLTATIGTLNKQVPGLELAYDKTTGALNRSIAAVKTAAGAELIPAKQQAELEMYNAALDEESFLLKQIGENVIGAQAARDRYREAALTDPNMDLSQLQSDIDVFGSKNVELQAALRETRGIINEIEQSLYQQSNAVADYETAVIIAVDSVSESLAVLAENYNKTYESAYNSISGTVGLFNGMKTESDLSTQKMLDNMKSQFDFIENYQRNIQEASRYGINAELVASLADGSKESAGYIDAIVKQYETLYWQAPEKAAEFVADFNRQFEDVQTAKDSFSATVAEMNTDFTSGMDDMKIRLTEFVGEMNMSEEAAKAARDTVNAYVDSMKNAIQNGGVTSDNIDLLSKVIQDGLLVKYAAAEANANGTTNSADVFIAGEKGPELIVGMEGSTVFPAGETAKIIDAVDRFPSEFRVPVPEHFEHSITEISETRNSSVKTVNLNLNGSGEIKVDGNISNDDVWEIVAPRLKPEIIRMIRQDIFEEGDMSYDF